MTHRERWREFLAHDGYVLMRLHLLSPQEGGGKRAIQSGYRADWVVDEREPPERAPIDFVDGRRSLKPGAEGLVRAYPLRPERWRNTAPGSEVALRSKPGRVLGLAVVEAKVDLPTEHVGLRLPHLPERKGSYLRRPSFGDADGGIG